MASWMIHLRIADKLLDRIPNLSPIEFIMGNMAPDSGVPNEDWTQFFPSKSVSHFQTMNEAGKREINLESYLDQYFSPALRESYDEKQYSFYLGYYTHLLADRFWSDLVAFPTRKRFSALFEQDRQKAWELIKEDWYDLDYLYLKKHPGFRAFRAYLGSVGFVNTYMDSFAPDAFDNRRAYITDFYLQDNDHLDREYPYLTEQEADAFVGDAVKGILEALEAEIFLP